MLIENGADVNLVTKEGWTAKDLAQENSKFIDISKKYFPIFKNISSKTYLDRLGIVKFLQEKMEETEPDNSTKYKQFLKWIFLIRLKLKRIFSNLRFIFMYF